MFRFPKGGQLCECLTGFYRTGFTCKDKDECEIDNVSVKGATCTNIPHSFLRQCKTGYLDVNRDASECRDIDECLHGQVCPDMALGFKLLF